jgi:hypothetical protein
MAIRSMPDYVDSFSEFIDQDSSDSLDSERRGHSDFLDLINGFLRKD